MRHRRRQPRIPGALSVYTACGRKPRRQSELELEDRFLDSRAPATVKIERHMPGMSSPDQHPISPSSIGTSLELWPGCRLVIDAKELAQSAISVKGCRYHSPTRFLEIFANDDSVPDGLPAHRDTQRWTKFTRKLFPRIPGVDFVLGPSHFQPPYSWKDADPRHICRSFTYNTNAFFRILLNLRDRGHISNKQVPKLLDRACRTLAYIYKADDSFVLKHINNNINMYLISKTVELMVGKRIYDAENQEMETTRAALEVALQTSFAAEMLSTSQKMSLAVRRGVSFVEERFCRKNAEISRDEQQEAMWQFDESMAIDHRQSLLSLLERNGCSRDAFSLVVVLDDATETVADLWWVSDLLQIFPFLEVDLIVNTAQISINFSVDMIMPVIRHPSLRSLADLLGTRLRVVQTYCPFISFQTSFLTPDIRELIAKADAVFIKGANFFETLQIAPKDTFYGFVVYGPVSQACTGLSDYESVWAYVPAGDVGYKFSTKTRVGWTLVQSVEHPKSQTFPRSNPMGKS